MRSRKITVPMIDSIIRTETGEIPLDLLDYYHGEKDYRVISADLDDIYQGSLQYASKEDLDDLMLYLGNVASGVPRFVISGDNMRPEIRELNTKIRRLFPDGKPGLEADIAGQNYWDYYGQFDCVFFNSQVLQQGHIREAESIKVDYGGYAFKFFHCKLTRDARTVDFHYATVYSTDIGEWYRQETIWNLMDMEELDQDEVDEFLCGSRRKYPNIPEPDTPFGIFHSKTPTTGPQDVIVVGDYNNENDLFVGAVERMMHWNREAKGNRRPWHTPFVMKYRVGPEVINNIKGHIHLDKICLAEEAVYTNNIHGQDTSCENNQNRTMLPHIEKIHDRPLHHVAFELPQYAEEIYAATDRNAGPDDFFAENGKYVRCTVEDLHNDLYDRLRQPTVQEPEGGNPAFTTIYCVNELPRKDADKTRVIKRSREIKREVLCRKSAELEEAHRNFRNLGRVAPML